MRQALELVGGFTADQWGMVTSRQAAGVAVDRSTLHRLEAAGYLDRVRRGVYASTTAAVTAARDEQAAWLALNPAAAGWDRPLLDPDGGVLSHQSAARLHGLGELVNDRITFTTPRRRTSRDPDLWFKKAELAEDDVTQVDGLPVTTALRTICDLLDQHLDGSHIATIIREAVLANLVRLDVLAERIGPYALRYGVRRPGDGVALLEHLLAGIGTSAADLARRPAPARTTDTARLLADISRAVGNPLATGEVGAGIGKYFSELTPQVLAEILKDVAPVSELLRTHPELLTGSRFAKAAAPLNALADLDVGKVATPLNALAARDPGVDDRIAEHAREDSARGRTETSNQPARVPGLAEEPSGEHGEADRRQGR
ncbi:type IV toxin-antitoxin system AbiEi family antitoxin domain-containing protein [Amycolatopsis australiensis]|nr:type IV toxin-antitoxin system AbiEi family antitoxin domain-containing protein [Amycolatopsis australiensis]